MVNKVSKKYCGVVAAMCLAMSIVSVAAAEPSAEERAELDRQMAEAKAQLQEATKQIAELSRQLAQDDVMTYVQRYGKGKRRAMLGVTIGDVDDDEGGVAINGVSPGGPAAVYLYRVPVDRNQRAAPHHEFYPGHCRLAARGATGSRRAASVLRENGVVVFPNAHGRRPH